ncbi:MAG TPA: hypothetical protein DDX39_02395 [Bacteroidales bacterium]|nr:MAG: hypothetical protein A2W98_05530 [Bacteroidetes bacterium GWF2_33_38]OFY75514.1 MAG: hypothetical protein A2265_05085 [Bacteroidetes bacterium RIFOXYA12_FULL_33_9]OFY91740.1 MAG: hypothetical protein A2236_05860 [Bacteroidetes bacterium RIFOXYA2_FULL_33_7]HBF87465.1 hypothetical protein [Bacteroidales bacterium]
MLKEKSTTKKISYKEEDVLHDDYDKWFTCFISHLKSDQIQLSSGLASPEKKEFYEIVMSNNIEKMINTIDKEKHRLLTETVILTYINELINERKTAICNLAFDSKSTGLKIWAVINDDDELAERNLILSEAKANYYAQKYNYHLSTTIVEKSDNFEIPSQYKQMKIGKF